LTTLRQILGSAPGLRQGVPLEKSIYADEYPTVVRLLKATRKACGLTQVELAQALGLTQSHLSKIERGEARIDLIQLRSYCQACDTTLLAFVTELERLLARPGRSSRRGRSPSN
jgi:transcriptional regulator with XRE-family HTH domain